MGAECVFVDDWAIWNADVALLHLALEPSKDLFFEWCGEFAGLNLVVSESSSEALPCSSPIPVASMAHRLARLILALISSCCSGYGMFCNVRTSRVQKTPSRIGCVSKVQHTVRSFERPMSTPMKTCPSSSGDDERCPALNVMIANHIPAIRRHESG
jgi:hypothetical protein